MTPSSTMTTQRESSLCISAPGPAQEVSEWMVFRHGLATLKLAVKEDCGQRTCEAQPSAEGLHAC